MKWATPDTSPFPTGPTFTHIIPAPSWRAAVTQQALALKAHSLLLLTTEAAYMPKPQRIPLLAQLFKMLKLGAVPSPPPAKSSLKASSPGPPGEIDSVRLSPGDLKQTLGAHQSPCHVELQPRKRDAQSWDQAQGCSPTSGPHEILRSLVTAQSIILG